MTAPSVAIVVAYRDAGCEHRTAALNHVLPFWGAYDEISLCDTGAQPFSRGASFNQGADTSSADVLVFTDADVLPEPAALERAVLHAYVLGVTAYPYRDYLRLSLAGTLAVMAEGGTLNGDEALVEWAEPYSVGGIFVCRRDKYLEAGGCDPRFVGWGFEDVAWSATSATLLGDHVREDGRLLHLWHPWDPHSGPASKSARALQVYQTNRHLCDRYTNAVGDKDAIRGIRSEAGLVTA